MQANFVTWTVTVLVTLYLLEGCSRYHFSRSKGITLSISFVPKHVYGSRRVKNPIQCSVNKTKLQPFVLSSSIGIVILVQRGDLGFPTYTHLLHSLLSPAGQTAPVTLAKALDPQPKAVSPTIAVVDQLGSRGLTGSPRGNSQAIVWMALFARN